MRNKGHCCRRRSAHRLPQHLPPVRRVLCPRWRVSTALPRRLPPAERRRTQHACPSRRARPDPFLSAVLQRQGARGRLPVTAVSRRGGTFKGRGRLPGTHVTFGPPKLRLHGRGTAGRARAAFRFLFQEGKHWWAAGAAAAAPALSLPPPASRSPPCPAHTRAHTRAVPHTRAHGHARRGGGSFRAPPGARRRGGDPGQLRGPRWRPQLPPEGPAGEREVGRAPEVPGRPLGCAELLLERCLSLLPSAASR